MGLEFYHGVVSLRKGKLSERVGRKASSLRTSLLLSMAVGLPKSELLAIFLIIEDNCTIAVNNILKYVKEDC